MQFHETQIQVAESKSRFKVLNCGRGWGKTAYAVEEAVHKAIVKGGSRVLYIAPTIQQARDIAWQRFKERCLPITIRAKEAPSLELAVKTMDDGESTIVLRGWEAVETLRGQEFDFIVLDEVASMRNFWVGWQEVLLPTFRMSKGGALFISTPKGFNHFYDLYNTIGDDWESFTFTSYDNPFIDSDEIDKAKETATEDRFHQEYMADFRKQEGLVYKEFKRVLHTHKKLPEHIKMVDKCISVDFGYRHPCAVLTYHVDDDGNYYVEKEWYKTEKTEEEIADYCLSEKPRKVFPDPENQSAIEVLRRKGLNIREVVKGKGSVQTGIGQVREAFLQGRLSINVECKNLLEELETYRYPEGNRDKITENPEKVNDDACDSLRYFVMSYQPEKVITPLQRSMYYERKRQGRKNQAV